MNLFKNILGGVAMVTGLLGSGTLMSQTPMLNILPFDTIMCTIDTIYVSIEISGMPGVWLKYVDPLGVSRDVNISSSTIVLPLTMPGTYVITQYGNAQGSVLDDPHEFVLYERVAPGFEVSGGGVYCSETDAIPVRIDFEGTAPFTFQYYDGGQEHEIQTTQDHITFPAVGSYDLQTNSIRDASGCTIYKNQPASFQLVQLPVPEIIGEDELCEQETAEYRPGTAQAIPVWHLSSGGSYIEAYDSIGTFMRVVWSQPGTHRVSLQNTDQRCFSDTVTLDVVVHSLPEVLEMDTALCLEMEETLPVNLSPNSDTIHWLHTGGTEWSVVLDTAGIYMYRRVNSYGCSNLGYIQLGTNCTPELHVPDAFSPNGDGINDELLLFGLYSKLEFSIYSASGVRLFYAGKDDAPWEGTFEDKPVPVGVYYWKAVYYSHDGKGHVDSGAVTIIR